MRGSEWSGGERSRLAGKRERGPSERRGSGRARSETQRQKQGGGG